MKKLLVFLVMMGVIGLAMAQTTNICFASGGVGDFTVTPSLIFPSTNPGTDTSAISTITLGDTNNVDLTLNVYLQDGSDSIFTNVELTTIDLDITGLPGTLTIGNANPIIMNVDDTDVEGVQTIQAKDILATLSVPIGTLPSVKTGVIVYEVVGPTPITCPA